MNFVDFMRMVTGDPLWGAFIVVRTPEHMAALASRPRLCHAYFRLAAGGGIGEALAARFFAGLPVPPMPPLVVSMLAGPE